MTRHPGWKLVRIYADEGISGTSLSHRDEFVQMIKDCEAGNDAEKYIDTIPNDPDNGLSRRCALFEDGMKPMAKTYKTKVVASPASWVESFGRKATGGSVPLTQGDNEPWRVSEAGIPYQVDKDLNPSTEAVLQQGIQDIVSTIQRRE